MPFAERSPLQFGITDMQLQRLAVLFLITASSGAAMVEQPARAERAMAIAAEAIAPSALGAVARPRWAGSKDEIPYVGSARLDWAFRLRLPRGTTVRHATISDYALFHLVLSNGSCVSAVPRNLSGGAIALDIAEEKCASTPALALDARPNRARCNLIGMSSPRRLAVWSDGDRTTRICEAGDGQTVAVLPLATSAIGGLPVFHGGGDTLTLFGRMRSDPVVLGLTVPLPPRAR